MLARIAKNAGLEMRVVDQDGTPCAFKLLNTQYVGIRKLHTDVQGMTPPQTVITDGTIIKHYSGNTWTVSAVTPDFYKGRLIRNALDLVENNNTVSVIRQTTLPNGQGGILGKSEETIYENIPVKIGTILQIRDEKFDSTDSQFGMLLSSKFPVKHGDRLEFGHTYQPAKVEGIKHNYTGVYEIAFDKDPRWT
jgi:hypothetical protein